MKKYLFLILLIAFGKSLFAAPPLSNADSLRVHLNVLTRTKGYRNHGDTSTLNKAAAYILQVFKRYADTVYLQPYSVNGIEYKNVIASFGVANAKRIIVGAHYDVCGNQSGADDNASGIAGLLELARMLYQQPLTKRIDLVAYTLEEPPYFRTEHMGSYIHAQSLVNIKEQVEGMVCLEMIGYFNEEDNSQRYPMDAMKNIYGTKANFISLVQKTGGGAFASEFARQYKKTGVIRAEEFTGPVTLPGIDFSDHLNYWAFGFSAIMISDTSFYRNKNYHQSSDTVATLNVPKMAKVVDGTYLALISIR